MMFWGDIILKYPKLIKELALFGAPTPTRRAWQRKDRNAPGRRPALRRIIALNWGYEADHPFESEAALFAKAKIPFYVCPGTSTWQTLIGRHDNALANMRAAAQAGHKHGAMGYLITDWGDGGHPQPLAVSYLPYLAGASLSWCAKTFDEAKLIPVLNRDVFNDPTGNAAKVGVRAWPGASKVEIHRPQRNAAGNRHRRAAAGTARIVLPERIETSRADFRQKHSRRVEGN